MADNIQVLARSIEPAWVFYKDQDVESGGEASRLTWLLLQAPTSRNALVSGSYSVRADLHQNGVLIQRYNNQTWQDVGLFEFTPYGDIPNKLAIRLGYFFPRHTPESDALEEAWAAARLHLLENGLNDRRLETAGIVPAIAVVAPSMVDPVKSLFPGWTHAQPEFFKVGEMSFSGSPAQFHTVAIRVENDRNVFHHRLPDPLPVAEPNATSARIYFLLYGVSDEFGYAEAVPAPNGTSTVTAYANENQLEVVREWWAGLRAELERLGWSLQPTQAKLPSSPAGRPAVKDYDWAFDQLRSGRSFGEVFAEWGLSEHAKSLIDPRKSLKNAIAARWRKQR